ncbi:MAG: GNAT family N-acetyltransferase [Acidobacteriota bacterium]
MNVTRTYLEMTDQASFRPAWTDVPEVRVERVGRCPASFYRYLYTEVGRAYRWQDRLNWSDPEITSHLADPLRSLWVMWVDHAPAGYAETRREPDGSVELAFFGLVPEYVGRGLGKHLLSVVVERAWELGARRIWLHTCTLDHSAALPNYLKRGFTPFKTEVYEVD